jgi:hypothetical protein
MAGFATGFLWLVISLKVIRVMEKRSMRKLNPIVEQPAPRRSNRLNFLKCHASIVILEQPVLRTAQGDKLVSDKDNMSKYICTTIIASEKTFCINSHM